MATRAANKRLAREYQVIQENPPEYITAHPSERNILEWHYIITGPPNTPYHNGQYWGTLIFPPNYPYAPPAIRMHTPSGRFQPSTRLCLSISDFHPKSFNPAWGISTILIGLLSFMTSEEMTTGSIGATEQERRWAAARSRWWNSTGGGSSDRVVPGLEDANDALSTAAARSIKAGDGGARFRAEFPDADEENWAWMAENRVHPRTGNVVPKDVPEKQSLSSPEVTAALRRSKGSAGSGAVWIGDAAVAAPGPRAREIGASWLGRNKLMIGAALLFAYVLVARAWSAGVGP